MTQNNQPVSVNDFDFTTGLPDDFDARIVEAIFALAPETYRTNIGNPMAIGLWLRWGESLVLPPPVCSIPTRANEYDPTLQFYSIGNDWQIAENGLCVIHARKPETKGFNRSSHSADLVAALFQIHGQGNPDAGKQFFAKRGYLMINANFFMGLPSYRWKRRETTSVGGEKGSVPFPIFLSVGGQPVAAANPGNADPQPNAPTSFVPPAPAPPPPAVIDYNVFDNALIEIVKTGQVDAEGRPSGAAHSDVTLKRMVIMKAIDFGNNQQYINEVVNMGRIEQLISTGKLTKDPATGLITAAT